MFEKTDILTFETDRATRLKQFIVTGSLSFIAFLAAFLYSIVIGCIIWALTGSLSITLTAIPLFMFYSTRWVWRKVANRYRFSIRFLPQGVAVGQGKMAYLFPYEEVEYISIPHLSIKASWISIRYQNKNITINLSSNDLINCINALKATCKNAIYKDEFGKEHLPCAATRPEKTMRWWQQHYQRRALWHVFYSFIFLLMTTYWTWSVIRLWMGLAGLGPFKDMPLANALRVLIIGAIFSVVCLVESWRSWNRARRIGSLSASLIPGP
jgi:hypothetical protein